MSRQVPLYCLVNFPVSAGSRLASNLYKTPTSVPSRRQEREGVPGEKQYDKKWQNAIKNSKKGGGLAAPDRASCS